ncbi:ATP-dependent Clp protease ATP-binding subunit [Nonomuraea phyllanthi]|uniref:ATP-dependent Clp protease ATP-binding subunit n=1 Tax=Nonomuraea phyllanthi TaxID=2219224 RepID=A0A5C4W9L0_9ACTN|nr:Clp protease N-terminal domain-containing protein [Nonomuraea phyllanthi]KAB8192408.1 ATP-dependent Clp protease ATP-binding subunit [Nonomuraea phyllanthi]
MPKINVYLPDELAEAVKESGVPVSAVCQRALEQAVRRVTAIRQTVLADVDWDQPSGALTHLTQRARAVLKLAADRAGAEGAASVGTEHLLAGMLAEGGNLALRVLEAMDIDVDQVGRDLARHLPTPEPAPAGSATSGSATSGSATPGSATSEPAAAGPRTFSGDAANALEFAVTEATSLGHNYVGCEHLLLGLVAEPDGSAGQVLRALGADSRLTRRAVTAALAGYVHLRAQAQQQSTPAPGQGQGQAQVQALLTAAIRNELQPLVQRLERLEERVGTDT